MLHSLFTLQNTFDLRKKRMEKYLPRIISLLLSILTLFLLSYGENMLILDQSSLTNTGPVYNQVSTLVVAISTGNTTVLIKPGIYEFCNQNIVIWNSWITFRGQKNVTLTCSTQTTTNMIQ